MRKLILSFLVLSAVSVTAQVKEDLIKMATWTTPFITVYYPPQLIRVVTDSTIYSLTHSVAIGQTMTTVASHGAPGTPGSWYKKIGGGGGGPAIDTTHFASKDSIPKKWGKEVVNDADNGWSVPFALKNNATIFYNGMPLRESQWTGVGLAVLTVLVEPKKYDKILIIN